VRVQLLEHPLVVGGVFCHFACAPLLGLLAQKVEILILLRLCRIIFGHGARKTLTRLLLGCGVLVSAVSPWFRFTAAIFALCLAMITRQIIDLLLGIKAVKSINSWVHLEMLHVPLLGSLQLRERSGHPLLSPATVGGHLACVVIYLYLVSEDLTMQTHRLCIKHAVISGI
jgi:hypothetical protein